MRSRGQERRYEFFPLSSVKACLVSRWNIPFYSSMSMASTGHDSAASLQAASSSSGTSSILVTATSPCISKISGQISTHVSSPTQASSSTLTFIFCTSLLYFSVQGGRVQSFLVSDLQSHPFDRTITIRASTFLDVIGSDREAESLDQQSVTLIAVGIIAFSYIPEINIM